MQTKILLSVTFLIVLMSGAAMYMYNKPASTTTGSAEFFMPAGDLFQEFERNEGAANKRYLNKVIEVTGRVADIEAVDSVGVNVTLESANPLFGIVCEFTDPNQSGDIRIGEVVKIRGLCTGMLLDVVLVKCSIEK